MIVHVKLLYQDTYGCWDIRNHPALEWPSQEPEISASRRLRCVKRGYCSLWALRSNQGAIAEHHGMLLGCEHRWPKDHGIAQLLTGRV